LELEAERLTDAARPSGHPHPAKRLAAAAALRSQTTPIHARQASSPRPSMLLDLLINEQTFSRAMMQ
jgi:hypothetical protein